MSNNYNIQLQSNNIDLQTVLQTLQNKAAGREQATPEISINQSNGLVTAVAGAKSSTYQLAFQPAKTITPTTTSQIAVSSGYYTGGNITVAGDSNLVAGNIKKGTSIFGVAGNYEGSGSSGGSGDGYDEADSLITRTMSSYTNDRVTSIGAGAFMGHSTLTSVNFPNCVNINGYALTGIGGEVGAFTRCTSLTTVSFPACTSIGNYAFCYCSRLTTASFPACTAIGSYAFYVCHNLKSLYLTNSVVCTLSNSNAFASTPIGGYSASAGTYGSIYVPASLVDAYKAATNWTYFADRIVSSEMTPSEGEGEEGGGSGEIITFTIKNEFLPGGRTNSYQAEQGMTWQDWIDSAYDTTSYRIMGSNIGLDQTPLPSTYIYYNNVKVTIADVIIADAVYSER